MKPFLAFKGYKYYPSAGMGDYIGHFDDLPTAVKFIKEYSKDKFDSLWWGQVVFLNYGRPTIVYKCWDADDWEEEFEEEFVNIPIIPV